MRDTDEQRFAGGERATAARLERLIGELRGVAGVEVDFREDGSPHVRVRLDGSATSEQVGDEIQRILATVESAAEPRQQEPIRRGGLGRSLGELLEANGNSAPLALHPPVAAPPSAPPPSLLLVAVEETSTGVSVRVADSEHGIAFSPVEDPNSLNEAVTAAVARLHPYRPVPHLEAVEVRDIAGASVLTVLLRLEGGSALVGSEVIRGGLPFTLGQAVWKALTFAG